MFGLGTIGYVPFKHLFYSRETYCFSMKKTILVLICLLLLGTVISGCNVEKTGQGIELDKSKLTKSQPTESFTKSKSICPDAEASGSLIVGQTGTYLVQDTPYETSLLLISGGTGPEDPAVVKFIINDEMTTQLSVGEIYQIDEVAAIQVIAVGGGKVTFCFFSESP